MKPNEKIELKEILSKIVVNHWNAFLKQKLKKNLIGNKSHSWITNGEDPKWILDSTLSRGYDSSMGNLYEKIIFAISEYYNDNTYSKIKGLNLKSNGKKWIVDIAFERDGRTFLIELKLGGQLDNKKTKSEAIALKERMEVLVENKISSDVKTYLGIITLTKGESTPVDFGMAILSLSFDRSEVLVERELFDFISNDTDVFDFIKNEIQPLVMKEWKIVRETIYSVYL